MITCFDCKFWDQLEENKNAGLCRYYPPQPISMEIARREFGDYEQVAVWPITRKTDRCSMGQEYKDD